jgi:hypothetical protein
MNDPEGWARICRVQAALTYDPTTRDFLLDLAAEYEALAAVKAAPDPDDSARQDEVARRLAAAAERLRAGEEL